MIDLLKGEDSKAELEKVDIEQVVSVHMAQPTIQVRHPWMKEASLVHCPKLPMEEIFEGSTRLARCCFYKLRPFEDGVEMADSEAMSSTSDTIRKWQTLREKIANLQIEAKVRRGLQLFC